MTTLSWPKRVTLGSAAVISVMTLVEYLTATQVKREAARVTEIVRDSNRVLVYFPALATDAVLSRKDFLPIFEGDTEILVDYAKSGYHAESIFRLVCSKLARYQGKELVIYGVSMGAGVALDFRRYLNSRYPQKHWFKQVKFIFYSPVTAASDVKLRAKVLSAAGFVFRGGLISERLWKGFSGYRLLFPDVIKFRTAYGEDKLNQLQDALSKLTMRLIASEMRAVHHGHPAGAKEFASDQALILTCGNDAVATNSAPTRLAEGFKSAEIVEILPEGHADMREAMTSGLFAEAIKWYLA